MRLATGSTAVKLVRCALLNCLCLISSTHANDVIRVDISPDNGRGDVVARKAEQWRMANGQSATQTFRGVTVMLRLVGNAGTALTSVWWKPGFDFDAAIASDGVTVADGDRGGRIEIEIRGLTPGRHSLATYHNSMQTGRISGVNVSVDGELRLGGVRPSVRVNHDDDAATAFVEFDARADRAVRVLLEPDGSGEIDNVVLNGFAIDAVDPARRATKPAPSDDDEHVPENPVLTWTPAGNAGEQRVYLGTQFDDVATATPQSKCFVGRLTAAQDSRWPASARDPLTDFFWRVDTVDRDQPNRITRGDVWRFRVRRLAFPEAEGYGRFAIGGRGGRVLEVTNLNDNGPGSLRAAVEAEGPRTVVFRVGGTIKLDSKVVVRHPYLTVAGQTAPGDGICVRGFTLGCLGTHDVILRHLRIRVGDEARLTMDGTGFASSDHCIMDHCSISWSIDEAVSSRGAGNITLQRCIVSEALNIADHKNYQPGKGHSFAGSISGNVGSFHHNLLAHCAGRNWSLAGGYNRGGKFAGLLDVRNNVVFNWEHRTTDGGVKALNFVNNYYLPGPATRVFHFLKPDAGTLDDPQTYFIAGNVLVGRPQFDDDNWSNGGVVVDPALIDRIRLTVPFCEPHVTTTSAAAAYESVLADVGANIPSLDAVDARILDEVRRRQATYHGRRSRLPGIIDSQADVGGWPHLRGGDSPPDSDHDGLPNDWEAAHGLDPNDAADGARDVDGDGHTQLENYLNARAARHRR